MKKQIGIWMDNKEAIIITLDGQNATVGNVKSTTEAHPKEEKKEEHKENNHGRTTDAPVATGDKKVEVSVTEKSHGTAYQKEIFDKIKNADEWYVCGPAETKNEFKKFITDNHSADLSKLKAVENAAHLSSEELTAKVKTFYKVK
jgi:hypothetical protein